MKTLNFSPEPSTKRFWQYLPAVPMSMGPKRDSGGSAASCQRDIAWIRPGSFAIALLDTTHKS